MQLSDASSPAILYMYEKGKLARQQSHVSDRTAAPSARHKNGVPGHHNREVLVPRWQAGHDLAGRNFVGAAHKSQLGATGHMNFEISVTDWAPERTTSGAISPPRLPDTTDGPTAEMRPKLEVTETS